MPRRPLSALLVASAWLAIAPAAPAFAAPSPSPDVSPTPAQSPTPAPGVVIHIGTAAVMTIREPLGTISATERAAVVQSRINQVLLHHPYLTWKDVRLSREGETPVIFWGQFPIIGVDAAHARVNNFSSPDLLAHAWANNLRSAIKDFFAAKKMPERALFRNERNSDFVYTRTTVTLDQPTLLRNTRYVFSPDDLEWGAGVKESGQNGFVVFVRKDAGNPPEHVYLGNSEGTFTQYDWIRPEDTP